MQQFYAMLNDSPPNSNSNNGRLNLLLFDRHSELTNVVIDILAYQPTILLQAIATPCSYLKQHFDNYLSAAIRFKFTATINLISARMLQSDEGRKGLIEDILLAKRDDIESLSFFINVWAENKLDKTLFSACLDYAFTIADQKPPLAEKIINLFLNQPRFHPLIIKSATQELTIDPNDTNAITPVILAADAVTNTIVAAPAPPHYYHYKRMIYELKQGHLSIFKLLLAAFPKQTDVIQLLHAWSQFIKDSTAADQQLVVFNLFDDFSHNGIKTELKPVLKTMLKTTLVIDCLPRLYNNQISTASHTNQALNWHESFITLLLECAMELGHTHLLQTAIDTLCHFDNFLQSFLKILAKPTKLAEFEDRVSQVQAMPISSFGINQELLIVSNKTDNYLQCIIHCYPSDKNAALMTIMRIFTQPFSYINIERIKKQCQDTEPGQIYESAWVKEKILTMLELFFYRQLAIDNKQNPPQFSPILFYQHLVPLLIRFEKGSSELQLILNLIARIWIRIVPLALSSLTFSFTSFTSNNHNDIVVRKIISRVIYDVLDVIFSKYFRTGIIAIMTKAKWNCAPIIYYLLACCSFKSCPVSNIELLTRHIHLFNDYPELLFRLITGYVSKADKQDRVIFCVYNEEIFTMGKNIFTSTYKCTIASFQHSVDDLIDKMFLVWLMTHKNADRIKEQQLIQLACEILVTFVSSKRGKIMLSYFINQALTSTEPCIKITTTELQHFIEKIRAHEQIAQPIKDQSVLYLTSCLKPFDEKQIGKSSSDNNYGKEINGAVKPVLNLATDRDTDTGINADAAVDTEKNDDINAGTCSIF